MTIYRAEYVLPVTSPPIRDGGVAVQNGVILKVGPFEEISTEYRDEPVEYFQDSAIVPGLVNCHMHLELTAFRGSMDAFDHDFLKWLIEITRLRKENSEGDQIADSALLGACEAAASGVTTVGDIGRLGHAGVEALKSTGLRGVVFQETEFSPSNSTAGKDFDDLRKRFEQLANDPGRNVRVGISPHAPYTVSKKLFEKIARYSIENKVPISIHAAESAAEHQLMTQRSGVFADTFLDETIDWDAPFCTTVKYLSDIGVLEAAPLLAHVIDVDEREIDLIAETGSKVAHCPKSNAKFGHGIAPFSDFIEKGIPVGIGSDSMASNNCCDILEEARFAGMFSRVRDGGAFLDPATLLEAATLGGATALGLDDMVGSLDPGKQADLTVISVCGIGQLPIEDICSTLIFSTGADSVEAVFVSGEKVYADGEMAAVDVKSLQNKVSVNLNRATG